MSNRSNSVTAATFITLAAIMLCIAGVWQMFMGIVALLNDEFFVLGQEYVLKLDATSWGWVHTLVGLLLLLAGIGLFLGQSWARWTAVVVACLSLIVNFFWLPWYPLWSILIIVVDAFIVWALVSHPDDMPGRA